MFGLHAAMWLAGCLLAVVTATMALCTPASAQDVRAHCAKVGNDDRVRPLPDALIPAARRMFEVSADTSDKYVKETTTVRCMDEAVWLCSYGANLICGKADISRVSSGAQKFCRGSPNSTEVPMSATGHATIYEWKCVGRNARIVGQIAEVDARGFIRDNWKKLE